MICIIMYNILYKRKQTEKVSDRIRFFLERVIYRIYEFQTFNPNTSNITIAIKQTLNQFPFLSLSTSGTNYIKIDQRWLHWQHILL